MSLGIAHALVIHLVERQSIERVAANLGGYTWRIVDEQDRVATAAERAARVLAGEVARRPQPRGNRLELLGVRGFGHEHDERRQIVVERAQAVRGPGAQAGAPVIWLPVCMYVMAGSWLIASVCMLRMKHMSSTMRTV